MPLVIKHKEKSAFVFLLNRNTYGRVSNKILTVFVFQNGVTAVYSYYCFHAFSSLTVFTFLLLDYYLV